MRQRRHLWNALAPAAVALGACGERPAPVATIRADSGVGGNATIPPTLPVGLDAYRLWAQLPYVRLGTRTFMRSTYDRSGGNEASDASHYLREVAPGNDVALDILGSGFLYFFRANHWHGSPWHFGVDGDDFSVSDTATATPDHPPATSTFVPAASFPPPLALTYATTQGADVSWVPMGFTSSLSIAHGHSHYGTGYFIYSTYDPGAALSQPIAAWDEAAPAPDVLSLLSRAGTDIAPTGDGVRTDAGTLDVPVGRAVTVVDLAGPSTVRVIRFMIPTASAEAIEGAHLRIFWDGRRLPSVDAPIPLFFGTGSLYNRSSAEYLVKAFPSTVQFTPAGIALSFYFPMPLQSSAHIELVGGSAAASAVSWEVRSVAYTDAARSVGYFHATYVDHGTPVAGKDLVLLDTTTVEGGAPTCGSFVGTSFIFSENANLGTLEGDPRFFFDDSMTPQAQGTGTEEWGAGGGFWNNGATTTLPLAGHPVGAPTLAAAQNPRDAIESAYRFLIADSFPFGTNARVQLEHGGTNQSTDHYQSVAYWYGASRPCLVLTDTLHVSDPSDEAAHAYSGPTDAGIDTVTSRYEWGVDHLGPTEIYPTSTDTGRHGTAPIELELALDPDNVGALLRRKLDYSFPDQRAELLVADAAPGAPFVSAGTWYLAGSNTCAFVDAPTETGQVPPTIETSDRRWRDDEILIPRSLTQGRRRVRIRVVPAQGQVWSEFRYTAYSYVMPTYP